MILKIDTSQRGKISLAIYKKIGNNQKILAKSRILAPAQETLFYLEKLLKKKKIAISAIKEIEVAQGPGSFTSLRIGITVACVLAYALKLPIDSQKPGTILEPIYQ